MAFTFNIANGGFLNNGTNFCNDARFAGACHASACETKKEFATSAKLEAVGSAAAVKTHAAIPAAPALIVGFAVALLAEIVYIIALL